jgi:hypothetical protein
MVLRGMMQKEARQMMARFARALGTIFSSSEHGKYGLYLVCRRLYQAIVACLAFGSRLQNAFSQIRLYSRGCVLQWNLRHCLFERGPHGLDEFWTE